MNEGGFQARSCSDAPVVVEVKPIDQYVTVQVITMLGESTESVKDFRKRVQGKNELQIWGSLRYVCGKASCSSRSEEL